MPESLLARREAVYRSLYGIALVLLVVPLLDAIARSWPIRLSEPGWRFGALSLVLNSLVTPLLGLALATLVAVQLGDWRTLRSLGLLAMGSAMLLLLAVALYALNLVEMHHTVAQESVRAFDVAALKTLVASALALPVTLWVGSAAWWAGSLKGRAPSPSGDPSKLVVGRV
jgi:ABC-type tungstate transport system substrate-binding protein